MNKNFKKIISSILILVFTLSSLCVVSFADESTLYIDMPENDELITKNPGRGWIRYGSASEVYDKTLAEKAWYYSNVGYSRISWATIEPQEGQYNWAPIDSFLEGWASKGMTAGFGIMCMDTTEKNGQYTTPKWVFDAGAESFFGLGLNGDETDPGAAATTYLPIQDDPIYMEKVENFIKALAERYDNDPRVEFIDIRSYGNYGEFHLIDLPAGYPQPSNEAMHWHVDLHTKYFKNTQIIIPTGFAYHSNGSYIDADYIYNQGIGVRHDGGYDKLQDASLFHGYAPAINEQGPPYEQYKATKGFYHDMYLDYIGFTKFSYMDIGEWGRNTETFIKEQEPIIQFLTNKLGYHFVMQGAELPQSVSAGQNFNITFDWINKGITYLYKNALIDVALLDKDNNVVATYRSNAVPTKNWAPEAPVKDTVAINLADVANGNYKLAVGIGLNEGKYPYDGKPDFQIGNYGMTADKWYVFANAVKSGSTFTFSKYIEENLVNGVSLCAEPVVANGMNYVSLEDTLKALSSNYKVENGIATAAVDTQMLSADTVALTLTVDGVSVKTPNPLVKIIDKFYVAVPALDEIAAIEVIDDPAQRVIMTQMYKGSILDRMGKVSNPGFEVDDNAWSYDSRYFNVSSSDKCEGEKSLHFAGNAQARAYQQFDVEDSILYQLKFKIKSEGPLTYKLIASNGDVLASKTTEATGGEWKEYTMNFDYVDFGTKFVQKQYNPATLTLAFDSLSDSKEGYIDDIRIERLGNAEEIKDPTNYVNDYGFESMTNNWGLYLSAQMSRTSDYAHSGTYSLKWHAMSNGCGVNYSHGNGDGILDKGGAGKYHFEGWFRTDKGNTIPKFGLDAFRMTVDRKVTEVAPHWSYCTLTDEWQKIEFDFEVTQEQIDAINARRLGTTRDNSATIHINLSSSNRLDANGKHNVVYMDDIKITKVD